MKTMTNSAAALMVSAALGLSAQVAQAGCDITEAACEIEGGKYHLKMPEGEVKGTILYLHGAGGSGAGSLNNKVWVPVALERGYAVAAPDGSMREGRRGRGWFFHPSRPKTRDDVAFLKNVRDDLVETHGLAADKIALGGFSIGGSMASYVACEDPSAFSAYVPVAGGIWRPHPTECAGPVKLLHTHGWTDTTVPLEGRVVNRVPNTDPTAFMQGDVFHTMGLWRAANGCVHVRADKFVTKGAFLQRAWERCDPNTALEFALFPGGHTVPEGWAEMAIDWIEGL